MTDTTSAAPTYQQVIAAWNAQADGHNQWSELGEDEKVEWAVVCAKTTPPAVVEPLTDEQIEDLLICGNPTDEEKRLIRMGWDAAHGIKGGQHGTE